tara:strand:+ start:197 stop:394 length:198 start_codon:yes stop_codon:yes gene_type:complete
MVITNSILRDEVKELENDMSVGDLIRYTTSDNVLIGINNVLEEIAIDRIIERTQDFEKIEKRGKV